MHKFLQLIGYACKHPNKTWPLSKRAEGIAPYQVCTTCGRELPYTGGILPDVSGQMATAVAK